MGIAARPSPIVIFWYQKYVASNVPTKDDLDKLSLLLRKRLRHPANVADNEKRLGTVFIDPH